LKRVKPGDKREKCYRKKDRKKDRVDLLNQKPQIVKFGLKFRYEKQKASRCYQTSSRKAMHKTGMGARLMEKRENQVVVPRDRAAARRYAPSP